MILLFLVIAIPGSLIMFFGFIIWSVTQAAQAARYRDLMAKQSREVFQAKDPVWVIKFSMNGKVREMHVPGTTEAEALKECLKRGGNPRGIVSIERGL